MSPYQQSISLNRVAPRPTFATVLGLLALIASQLVLQAAYAQNSPVTVNIDVNGNRRAISPLIYGLASASSAQLTDLNVTLNRYGGNNASRYNWQ